MREREHRFIAFGVIFIFGVGAGWIVKGRYWDAFFSSYVPALATLLAAYYGARFAFQYQADKEKEESKRLNIRHGNAAIFTLMRMANSLRSFQIQFLNPARESQFRFIEIPQVLHYVDDDIKLNIDALYFLLRPEGENLLSELVIASEKYHVAIDVLNERSRLLSNSVPLLDRAGITSGGQYSLEQIKEALGERLYNSLVKFTDYTFEDIDDTINILKPCADKLRASLQKLHPNETIIGFEYLNQIKW